MSVWDWADDIAPVPAADRISLGEGGTPLVRSRKVGPSVGLPNFYFKLETGNPTGSYKDRYAAVAVSHMRSQGRTHCVATSSGNTGAALAAYCAVGGLRCEIAVVETAPAGKLTQMLAYGAELYRVRGFGLDPDVTRQAFEAVRERGSAPGRSMQISAFAYSPEGMSGVQTISYELARQLPGGIDHVFCCAGGGGLTLAVARGFVRLTSTSRLSRGPAVECVQPEGNATIAGPLRDGAERAVSVTCTSNVSGLQVPNVIDGDQTLAACRASGGTGHLIADAEAYGAQARLAREEGIFCEPAAAVPLAGALRAAAAGRLRPEAVVVCLVTGVGFKDAASAERLAAGRPCPTLTLDELRARD
jgi:threonine synthase